VAAQHPELSVAIIRFVMDHQPPIVACEFADAQGRCNTFVGKVAMFGVDWLDGKSKYPQPGVVRCTVLRCWHDATGQQLVTVSTADPDGVESTEGLTQFDVLRTQVTGIPSETTQFG
jgi:hypothetical protein